MSTLHRSEFREEMTSSELWWCADRVVSSANISATELLRDISFIYKRNKVGPRTEPWGTPDTTSPDSEYAPETYTSCFLLFK